MQDIIQDSAIWLARKGVIMMIVRVAAFATAFALALPPTAHAGFMWLNTWDVDLDMDAGQGIGSKRRAFGATAVNDGDVKNTGADVAVARAEALASTNDVNMSSRWDATVDFERPFKLEGSPGGWLVELKGVLSGRLVNLHPEQDAAIAQMIVFAKVLDKDRNTLFSIDDFLTRNEPAAVDVFHLLEAAMRLGNGEYAVSGELYVKALVAPEPLRGDVAVRFFDGGFAVSLLALAIPEPSSLLLVLLGGSLLIFRLRPTARAGKGGAPA